MMKNDKIIEKRLKDWTLPNGKSPSIKEAKKGSIEFEISEVNAMLNEARVDVKQEIENLFLKYGEGDWDAWDSIEATSQVKKDIDEIFKKMGIE